ncbi:uncharacterized protein LOC117790308 [Drosophila innubila]|uniref:uncharacterized protein LOC117790308 n=1 Tax=Drosophila innubila TaxID=198719 RepID=UPI00148CDCEC|nr:uncharacterized protein LOC117790308 [Drosophila innubila]
MASHDATEPPISKLAQMRMRFQQKTHEEKEQRRQELNIATETATAARGASSRLMGNGKVRQMFDERRRGAGIDRSNLLRPIGDLRAQQTHQTHQQNRQHLQQLQQRQHQQQQQHLIKGFSTLGLKDKPTTCKGRQRSSDSNNNNSSIKYNAPSTGTNANRLKPVITHKTPPNRDKEVQLRVVNSTPPSSGRTMTLRRTPKATTAATATTTASPATRPTAGRSVEQEKGHLTPPKARQVTPKSPVTKSQMNQQAPEGTSSCRYCGRHFNTERLGKHEDVCQRTMTTKRKIFDASKQRVKGTDNEKYAKRQRQVPRSQSTYSSAAQQQGLITGVKKSNWRKKHEEFIQAIRAAKQVQAHLARGGKLSDLPPPPPSENPDYIQCPHCGRRFNQQAAERHIPRCATMVHNKPRRSNPQAVAKKR